MKIIDYMITTLCALIAAGSAFKLITLGLEIMNSPDEKNSIHKRMKNVILVLIISLTVGSSPVILNLIYSYYK
ncbi:MAG: hypothetical protein K0R90_1427 [Oscillospiraceae bacterium]|jgi:hypothetical protein|nr:hypothetical protein [Oscillospiraceae bacterium]